MRRGVRAPSSIVGTGDFDGDGKADLLWRDSASGITAVWLRNGAVLNASGVVTSSHACGMGGRSSGWVSQLRTTGVKSRVP